MINNNNIIICIFIIILLFPFSIYSYTFNSDFSIIGVRNTGMGGAYSSIIDNSNFNHKNPAAINFNQGYNFSISYRFPSDVDWIND